MASRARSTALVAGLAGAAVLLITAVFVLVRIAGSHDDRGGRDPATPIAGLFAIPGAQLYLECAGTGSPTVVFDAGLGDGHRVWRQVRNAGAGVPVRICAYDRRGVGDSSGGSAAGQSVADAAADLRALLAAAGVAPPYVLVSHSIAGLLHRYYTKLHPDEVAGLVLIDTAPDDWDRHNAMSVFRAGGEALDIGTVAATLRAGDDLGDRPLVVIRAARTSEISAAAGFSEYWSSAQRRLAGLSRDAVHIVAADSNHNVPVSQPDLVAAAVALVVDAVRNGQPLPPCPDSPLPVRGGACIDGND